MENSKEELRCKIEHARKKLNYSIDINEKYDEIYKNSIELDQLIELYLVSDF